MDQLDQPMKIKIGEQEIVLDSNNMEFNEVTLNNFIQKEHAYYDHFGRAVVNLEALHDVRKADYERLRESKFDEYKTKGNCSDKLASARSESDEEVVEARQRMISAKRSWKLVQQHLRAWDKAHDNALNLSYNIRKEMDKLGISIKDKELEKKVSDVLKKTEE